MRTIALIFLAFQLLSVSAFGQGSLTPPGAPAPTMKTLDQIEARTPIESLPFSISQSGSYYLTRNLQFSSASGHAITIAVSNVTLDLMGFTLSSTSGVTGDAIHFNGGLRNVAINNGAIVGETVVTVSGSAPNQSWSVAAAGFAVGINAGSLIAGRFKDLSISGCRTTGLSGGTAAVIENVIVSQNGTFGITTVNNSSVDRCIAQSNGSAGVSANTVSNSNAMANAQAGIFALAVINCVASNNGGNGISVPSGSVSNSLALSNAANGISFFNAGSVTNSAALSNKASGIVNDSGSVTNCIARSNGSDGIYAPAGVVAFCRASANDISLDGSVDIDATGATRTGNNPTP